MKDPRENRRTGSWPTAAFCPLFPSLIGAHRYLLLPFGCTEKEKEKREKRKEEREKRKDNGQRQSIL